MTDAENHVKLYWPADAANIDASAIDFEKYITKTARIEEFISSNKFIVAAPKGYGKTLLLKYRRLSNVEQFADMDSLVIPTNIAIDSFDNAIPFDDNFRSYLENQSEWENLWQISIGLSLIIHYALKYGGSEFIWEFLEGFRSKNNRLGSLIGLTEKVATKLKEKLPVPSLLKIQANPSSLLPSLLATSLTDLRASTAHALDCIHQGCLAIEHPVFLYIDQIDQGVKEFPLNLWRNAQNGVVGAIFRLHNPNKHIKIYSSIRLEAWDSCEGELYTQYKDYVSKLDYKDEDLKQIFEHAIRVYEDKNSVRSASKFTTDPIGAFIGLGKIHNSWGDEDEDVFKYMLRHSLRRPRDLILFGGGVHELLREGRLTDEEFRSLVNQIPGKEIRQQYLLETLRFSESLKNVNLQRFFSLTHKNVFSLAEMIDICSQYNEGIECQAKTRKSDHLKVCKKCTHSSHIFCDLYRIGLLGIVKKEDVKSDKSKYQYFNTPGHIRSEHLPNSPFYILHPAMDYYIKEEQSNNLFSPVRGIIVGQGRKWHPKYDALILLGRLDEFFRLCSFPVSEDIIRIYNELVTEVATSKMSNSSAHIQNNASLKIIQLRENISSDTLLAKQSFIANALDALDKLNELLEKKSQNKTGT